MTNIVKATNAATLLGYVPSMLGYVPDNSVVILPMANGRTLGAMRFDLPDVMTKPIAQTLVGTAMRVPQSTGCIVIIYGPGESGDYMDALEVLDEVSVTSGYAFIEDAAVGTDGFRAASTHYELHPLSEIPTTHVLPIAASRMVEKPVMSCERLAAIAMTAWPEDPREDLVFFAERMLMANTLPDYEYPKLYVLLNQPSARDICITQWVADRGEEALTAQLAWENGTEYPQDLAQILWGRAPRPEASRLERALEHVLVVCSMDDTKAGAWATAAWLSWAMGKSTHAGQYADWALEAEPEHGLAAIVRGFVQAGHLPEWAFVVA